MSKDIREIPEPDYSRGCAMFNEISCDCDTNANECKGREYKIDRLLEELISLRSENKELINLLDNLWDWAKCGFVHNHPNDEYPEILNRAKELIKKCLALDSDK
jgi:hypothetical protein